MAKNKTRILLVGASGRLGSKISEIAHSEFASEVEIAGTISRSNSNTFLQAAARADVIVDTSMPPASEQFLKELRQSETPLPYVIGCTGWTDAQMQTVRSYAKSACVIFAPNFSPGVTLFLNVIEKAAPVLLRWGYKASIHETHHAKKLDAPSGTAKAIVSRITGTTTIEPEVRSTRIGNVVGTHEVRFQSKDNGDVLTFTHEALDRAIFARGAICAARWAARQAGQKQPGLYSMADVVFDETLSVP
jgi:4-hydroxy-tetrahydrodipicolinate reductase